MADNPDRIREEFALRQGRQTVATLAAMLLVIVFGLLSARTELLGPNTRRLCGGAQVVIIAAFIGFTMHNWRCPACRRHLGGDLFRRGCRHCGARFS